MGVRTGGEELNERSRQILEIIIEDYIASAEPVGSRAVTRRHSLDLSPATVRNVMADLEDLGFLDSPHTSAGRVPTEKGYRFYVDSLLRIGPLSRLQQERIERYYSRRGLRMEERLREAGRLLSAISHYTGLVMVPRLDAAAFRQMEFIQLSRGRILVVLVTESGLVQNKMIEIEEEVDRGELEQMANYLNRTMAGLTLLELKQRIAQEMAEEKAQYDDLMRRALKFCRETFGETVESQVLIEGASRILEQPEFADVERMKRLLRAFEQKSVLVELLDKCQQAQGVQIFIGSETRQSEMEGCSLVTASYSSRSGTLGTLGVIGPTRMPYSMVIPIVDYTAKLVSQLFVQEH